jgi:hypothetical protein
MPLPTLTANELEKMMAMPLTRRPKRWTQRQRCQRRLHNLRYGILNTSSHNTFAKSIFEDRDGILALLGFAHLHTNSWLGSH